MTKLEQSVAAYVAHSQAYCALHGKRLEPQREVIDLEKERAIREYERAMEGLK